MTILDQLNKDTTKQSNLVTKVLKESKLTAKQVADVQEALGDGSSHVVDLASLQLWDTPPSDDDCGDTIDAKVILKEIDDLRSSSFAKAIEITKDPFRQKQVRAWIRQEIQSAIASDSRIKEAMLTPAMGDVSKAIQEVLRIDSSDQTGYIDFAALHNGAQIIRSRTSPSLKDELPLWNRLLATL